MKKIIQKSNLKIQLKRLLKDNYKIIIAWGVFLALNLTLFFSKRREIDKRVFIFGLIATFLIFSLTLFILIIKRKKDLPVHKLFLVFAVVFGLLYVFINPIGGAPDEPNHFRRAYEITNGSFISKHADGTGVGSNNLPETMNEIFKISPKTETYSSNLSRIKASFNIDKNLLTHQEFGNTSLYSFVPYLPQIAGIIIGRILHLPMVAIIYMARLFNLAFWIMLVYFAIKTIPQGKTMIWLVMASPISMQAAASCQADGFTNAVVIALLALALAKLKTPTILSSKEKIIIILLSIGIAMSKIVYVPVCLLLFLIPSKCFGGRKNKIIFASIIIVISGILNLIWLAISSGYLIEFQPGVSPSEQVKFILTHPHNYLVILFNTYSKQGLNLLLLAFGSELGWFTVPISSFIIALYIFFIFYVYLAENANHYLVNNLFDRLIIAAILLTCWGLISTSLYVQWTALKANQIAGLQGRYFIALIPFLLFLIKPLSLNKNRIINKISYNSFLVIMSINCFAILSIMLFYA